MHRLAEIRAEEGDFICDDHLTSRQDTEGEQSLSPHNMLYWDTDYFELVSFQETRLRKSH